MPMAELKSNGWVYVWKTCSLQGSHGADLNTSEIVETGQLEGCHDLYAAMHLGVRIGKRVPSVIRILTIVCHHALQNLQLRVCAPNARRRMFVPFGIGTTYSQSTLSDPSLSILLKPIWQSLDDFLTSQVDVFASLDTRCADLYPKQFFLLVTRSE